MGDGQSWYPGSDDPRYDPYGQPQPPQQRRSQQPAQQQPQRPQYPQGYRQPGPGQGQGQPQPGRGPVRGPGGPRYDAPADPYDPYAPPRRSPQPPQQRPARHDGPSDPYAPPPRRESADVWQAPDSSAEPADEIPVTRRRRSGGSGPGRQTEAPSGPGRINPDLDLDELDPEGRAQRAWEREKARMNRPPSRTRQATKWGAIGVSLVLVAGIGFAGYIYETTIGSIKSTPLLPNGMTQAALPPDKYGNTALNILLIGSDTRDTAGDCSLGGDCGSGANADSEMILHVSPERTNATILSIPRDTFATLPDCVEDKSGNASLTGSTSNYQINSALQNGPECQVAAVHALTGITFTGYIMFDFSGIVTMSNALGGVPVCVTHAVNDKDSGLKLPAGTSVIKGDQALEFLRTRHSFFDGSDLGREMATHYFLSQLIATMRKSMNFSDLSTLLSISQAASKSTTISNTLAGLSNLEGLIESLNKVPSKNITMLTMPWQIDPNNAAKVIPESSAATIFKDLQNDTSFTNTTAKSPSTTAPAKAKASATPTANTSSVVKSQVTVHVYNADGVAGRAGTIVQALSSAGFTQASSQGDAQSVTSSLVYYNSSSEQAGAQAVAAALGLPSSQVQQNSNFSGVNVFVGSDFESGTKYKPLITVTATEPQADTSGAASAPPSSGESFATDSSTECVPWFSGSGSGTLSLVHE